MVEDKRTILADVVKVLSRLDQEARARPANAEIHDARGRLSFRLGWFREAKEAAQAALAIDPGPLDRHLRLDSLFLEGDDRRSAADRLAIALRVAPSALEPRLLRARLLCDLGEYRAAAREASRCARSGPSSSQLLEVADVLIESGEVELAQRCLERASADDGSTIPAAARSARLLLWRGDYVRALAKARAILLSDAACGPAHGVIGGALVSLGRIEEALPALDGAIRLNPADHDALVWRSEARRRLGQFAAAIEDAGRAVGSSQGGSPAADIAFQMAVAESGLHQDHLWRVHAGISDVLPQVARLISPSLRASAKHGAREFLRAMGMALGRLRGNRSRTPTIVSHGRLERIPVASSPRLTARRIQQLIRCHEVDHVLGELDALVRRHPRSPIVRCHRGEVLLWIGRAAEARDDFGRALQLDRMTVWAWIGLVGVAVLDGRLDEAFELDATASRETKAAPGRSMYVYRGEAHRKRGHREEARRDLEEAVRLDPGRASAWINLALLEADQGEVRLMLAVLQTLQTYGPGLIIDAAAELAMPLRPWPPAPPAVRALLERCLAMMRGNRSSVIVTYFAGDRIRFMRPFATRPGRPAVGAGR